MCDGVAQFGRHGLGRRDGQRLPHQPPLLLQLGQQLGSLAVCFAEVGRAKGASVRPPVAGRLRVALQVLRELLLVVPVHRTFRPVDALHGLQFRARFRHSEPLRYKGKYKAPKKNPL